MELYEKLSANYNFTDKLNQFLYFAILGQRLKNSSSMNYPHFPMRSHIYFVYLYLTYCYTFLLIFKNLILNTARQILINFFLYYLLNTYLFSYIIL